MVDFPTVTPRVHMPTVRALIDEQYDAVLNQSKTFLYIQRTVAILSVLGSSAILFIILYDASRKLKRVRNRLLFAMSVTDVIYSTALAFGTAAIPKYDGWRGATYGTVGNTATCTAQGFFIQLGFMVPLYNCMLCAYFMLVIISKKPGRVIARKYEPFMHGICLIYGLSTSITGVVLDLYNSKGSFCWIEPWPMHCANTEKPCIRGINAFNYQLYFAASVLGIAFPFITMAMLIIYFNVRKTQRALTCRDYSNTYTSFNQTKETGYQALLYVLSFAVVWIWPIIVVVVEMVSSNIDRDSPVNSYWVLLLFHIFMPSQGIWNFITYIRPRFVDARRRTPTNNFFYTLKSAILYRAQDPRQCRINFQPRITHRQSLRDSKEDIIDACNEVAAMFNAESDKY